ncbi:16S rRNA (guanine(527)-N(7))-methyltransferase RsmG [Ideonella sp. B7]|uniref:16S rRNA (guanine(527)-N(7))-methyltransferase RsmG n=1 Tax=Ideonella benzenivorans TaxID=2831643 RepID=UPI001CECF08A|nr:16S rRNA (guanine(527)-N(7))-methyltransferase RsmG [Ideonella benzenivorans]MCA6218351.1 16S rRNA (guanine(527)-N(7))-methyltransferase RsmG [Ideonella benzenivorans]
MTHPLHAELARGLAALHLPLADDTQERLLAYLDLIARWNKVYNLTAVRDPADMLRQHLLDCLAAVPALDRAAQTRPEGAAAWRILDVGSGAGLPGVVLAIVRPDWSVTCVDTVAKKASFIRQVAAELGLPNLQAVHQRVEDMAPPPFDLITSRAFASLADFIALTRERLAPGGQWVAMKAHLTDEERAAVPPEVQIGPVEVLQVPGLDAQRCLVWLRPRA